MSFDVECGGTTRIYMQPIGKSNSKFLASVSVLALYRARAARLALYRARAPRLYHDQIDHARG